MDLLDARKAEPSRSSILAILDDYAQRQPGAPRIVQPMLPQWLDLAFADRDRIEVVVAEALVQQPNISANEFRKFIEDRARAIAALLVANMTVEDGEDIAARVGDLAANTFASHLADARTRERLVDVFRRIAETYKRAHGCAPASPHTSLALAAHRSCHTNGNADALSGRAVG